MATRSRIPGLGGWGDDPLWGHFYDWTVDHPTPGRAIWALGLGSDLGRLYDATAEIGVQPAGAAILDVPCGGGVALRGVRPGQGIRYVAADISQLMLDRTMAEAETLGVADQVEPRIADVHALEFADGEFDMVLSFTGLHCFPDPHRAVLEMGRVTRTGGVLLGSALLNTPVLSRGGLRSVPVRRVGRLAGLLGPGCTRAETQAWIAEAGFVDVDVEMSGPIGYFRGVRT